MIKRSVFIFACLITWSVGQSEHSALYTLRVLLAASNRSHATRWRSLWPSSLVSVGVVIDLKSERADFDRGLAA